MGTTSSSAGPSSAAPTRSIFEEGFLGNLHKPGENPQVLSRLRDAHLKATGGAVWTRFPPEPNAIYILGTPSRFSSTSDTRHITVANATSDTTIRIQRRKRRADFESILETVRWLGYEPWKITYSSDYFQQLYDLAVELIRRDKAYVCHCTGIYFPIDFIPPFFDK